MRDLPRDLSSTLLANLSEIPTGCCFLELSLVIDVPDVLHNIGTRNLKQLRQLLLCQPYSFILKPNVDLRCAILCCVQQDLAIWCW